MGATRLSAPARHAGVHLTFPKTVLRQTFLCFTLGLCFIGSSASAWAQSTPAYCSTNIQEEQAIFETHLQYSRNPHIDQIFKVKPPLLSIQVPGVVLATTQVERIKEYLAKKYRVQDRLLDTVVKAAFEQGKRHQLDPLLLLAIVATESRFDPQAQSVRGAMGLMQVIPKYHQDKIGDGTLFDPANNIRVGSLVLREGLERHGSLKSALAYYSGGRRGYVKEIAGLISQFENIAYAKGAKKSTKSDFLASIDS